MAELVETSKTGRHKGSRKCPLCGTRSAGLFHKDRVREYLSCRTCGLVFVPSYFHLKTEEQKSRYDLHINNPEDPGYRAFLSKVAVPLSARLSPGATGIDFGSGPGPTLHALFHERGFGVVNYDPFYAPDSALLNSTYDFAASTETVEHFCVPSTDWATLFSLLKPRGLLGVMTYFLPDAPTDFAAWRYKDDPTHVAFYSEKTFLWIAKRYGCQPEFIGDSVVIFTL